MATAKEILSILSDDTNLQIMKLLDGKELSIQQISSQLGIPLSSAYRKMGKMEQLQILKKTKIVRRLDGLDESFYTTWTYEITINYKDNNFSFRVKQKSLDEKIVRLWQKFKH
jgi:DNA-binding transcriptional ArsR family regulator